MATDVFTQKIEVGKPTSLCSVTYFREFVKFEGRLEVMQELQIFNNEEFGEVRTVVIDNEPMFCLSDICKALNLSQPSKVKERLNEKGVNSIPTLTAGGTQQMLYINESNLYKAIFQSRKESAERFTDWVTSEVLPTLRKTGTYSVTTTCQYPVSAAAIESATNAGRLFERIMKSEGIPPHEIAMAVRDIFLQAGINVPDYVIRIPAYEQLAMTFGKSGEVACS